VIPAPDSIRRIVYLGTPQMAVPPLLALHAAGYDIPLVVSRADKRRGRGKELTPSPVKQAAIELGLEVTDDPSMILDVEADLGVVVAYGRLISPQMLDVLAMVNIHFSLLPRWRGAAPVQRAILAGDSSTGTCLMQLAEGLDTGDVYGTAVVDIDPTETAVQLTERLVQLGSAQLISALGEGLGLPDPQIGEATYAAKIFPDDLDIDFTNSAEMINRQIRVGGAHTLLGGKRFKIWEAEVLPTGPPSREILDLIVGTGTGALRLITVQPEGKPKMDAASWANGAQPNGELFGR
jgi:methionyl-tRNA formyltransferase